jgi:sec-independent protein translocase protein TatA
MFRSPLTDGLVVLVILLLIVGPKKLPQLGRGLGDGMREFKEGITGDHKDEEPKQPLSAAQPMPGTDAERPSQPAATSSREAGSERSA